MSVTGSLDKWLRSLEYNYDLNNNVSHFAFADNNVSFITAYTYGKDNLLEKTTLKDGTKVDSDPDDNKDDRDIVSLSYTYDNLGRLTGKSLNTTNAVNTAYTYQDSDRGTVTEDGVTKSYTTFKIETETVAGTKYKYAYDVYGNITHIYSVSSNDVDTLQYLYDYDEYNQLTDVYDYVNSQQYEYEYDESGNITSRIRYAIGASGVPTATLDSGTYSYGDSQWKDLLTSYNGQTITYDTIGNPLNYRDGISLTWQNGRKLAAFANADTSVAYTYDVDGMRTGKSVTQNATTTEYTYVYENGLLLQMTRGSRVYDFIYDANGTPVSIAYRTRATATPSYYYYGTNWRGDVVALYSSTGAITALYEYDAYGNVVVKNTNGQVNTSETHIANINPLRYRGYVYDNETGLYYLQSRYYDPTTCRFVNGDGQLNIDTFTGFNQFAYCNNNPMMNSDPCGHKAGSYFGSIEAAMRDFAENYNIQSIQNNWEYGAFIYAIDVEVYVCYNMTRTKRMYSYSEPFTDESPDGVKMYPERNTVDSDPVALAHTHAAYSFGVLNERFSFLDEYLAKETYGLDIYVATPKGKIKKYMHETGDTILIYGETWHDRRTRVFLFFNNHSCDKCAN